MYNTLKYIGLALLAFFTINLVSCTDDDPSVPQAEHFEPEGWVFIDATGNRFMTIWQGKFDESSDIEMSIAIGETSDHIRVKFLDENKNEIDSPDDDHYKLSWKIFDESLLNIDQHEEGEFEFHLEGLKSGTTQIEFYVMHEDHIDVRTIQIPVIIK